MLPVYEYVSVREFLNDAFQLAFFHVEIASEREMDDTPDPADAKPAPAGKGMATERKKPKEAVYSHLGLTLSGPVSFHENARDAAGVGVWIYRIPLGKNLTGAEERENAARHSGILAALEEAAMDAGLVLREGRVAGAGEASLWGNLDLDTRDENGQKPPDGTQEDRAGRREQHGVPERLADEAVA